MPVGPEFEDPPPAEEQKPYIVDSNPYQLMVQTFLGKTTYPFYVEVGDPNPNDTLYARWVANYPNFTQGATTQLVSNEDIVGERSGANHDAFFMSPPSGFSCQDFLPAAANSLAFIVSDRHFLDPDTASGLDSAHRYNFDSEKQKVLTMINWPIIGCQ